MPHFVDSLALLRTYALIDYDKLISLLYCWVFGLIMENFIEKVKLHPCLWRMNDISYRDTGKKDSAWERIARECGMEHGKEAKSHWKKLRDSHREAMRRRKSSGQAAQNLKQWKYEILMEFLLSQTETRETNASNTSQESHDTHNTSDTSTNNDVMESPSLPSESPFSITMQSRKKNKQREFNDVLQRREKNREQRRTERDELRRNSIDSNRPRDALSDLFSSLCQKTRDLPKYLQLRVQREIFETITRAEEDALSYDSMNSYYCATPSTSSSHGYASNTNCQTSLFHETCDIPDNSPLHEASPLPQSTEYADGAKRVKSEEVEIILN